MKRLYQYLIMSLLLIVIFGCSDNGSKLAEQSLREFILAAQNGNLKVAQDFISEGTHNVKVVYDDPIEIEIIKSIFTSLKQEIISVEKRKQGNVKINMKVLMVDTVVVVESTLDQLIIMGLSGSIMTGFQDAFSHSSEVLIKNIKNASLTTKDVSLTFTEKDGKYYIIADQELYNLIGKDIEIILNAYRGLKK